MAPSGAGAEGGIQGRNTRTAGGSGGMNSLGPPYLSVEVP